MAKNKKSFSNYKVIGLAVVVIAFAALGVKLLNNSSAASTGTPTVGFYNYTSAANNDGVNVFTSQDSLPGIGTQYVSDITPGKQLAYSLYPGKLVPTSTCYYLRAYNSPKSAVQVTSADVTLTGYGNSVAVTLPADANYREVCVPSGRKAPASYNVANNSNAAYVLVYQAITHY